MSIQKQVKDVLKSKEVSQFIVEYENGSSKQYLLDGKKSEKSVIKSLIKSIDWKDVAEVQFVLADDEDDDEEDIADENIEDAGDFEDDDEEDEEFEDDEDEDDDFEVDEDDDN
ncbi:hypothetical protein ACFQZE_20625 [Paenibacillus sp. GCM10027627]|uniref:hypothetical protein n=1 Tax=unclassified Paenibacillus TaxID=185978 RepID=UPI003635EC7F